MTKQKFFTHIIISALILSSCRSQRIALMKENYSKLPKTSKVLDIPIYKNPHPLEGMNYVYWHFAKQKEKQLGLPAPETAETKEIFRVWITNPIGKKRQPHAVINLICDSNTCDGELVLMYVDFNARTLEETIVGDSVITLQPTRLSWLEIRDSLINLKFHQLPTDDEIPNYYEKGKGYGSNSATFSFEYSTKDLYRFYQYNDLYRANDEFWQPQNVINIFELLEKEFQWDERARQYF